MGMTKLSEGLREALEQNGYRLEHIENTGPGTIIAHVSNNTPFQASPQPRHGTNDKPGVPRHGGNRAMALAFGSQKDWDTPHEPDKRESKEMKAIRHYTPPPPRKP